MTTHVSPAAATDPVTIEVVRNSLPAAANEMAVNLQRSSYNMMIYEVRDYSCALLDAGGRLLAQNVGGVSHFVSDLDVVVKDALERFGRQGFRPGDGYIMNHQAVCGQHLNNVVAYTPVFVGGELFAFSMVRAHWVDVGGLSTGFGAGASGLVSDPWVEGLQFDQLRVIDAGVPDEKVLKLIGDNVRYPDAALGDPRAQLAACAIGGQRVSELAERYGRPAFSAAVEKIFEDSELRCRRIVEAIPDGEYAASSFLDHDFVERDRPVKIVARVVVDGSDMTIDLSGCDRERRGPINARTRAAAYIAYKALTLPLEPLNEGMFAALTVVIDEGNFMMARFPAPMASWSTALPTVVDTILRALAPALRETVPAAHFATLGGALVFFGTDPSSGRRFVLQSIEGGGWGGRPWEDGEVASVSVCQGDVRNAPIETLELKFPVRVVGRALRQDSGGAGRFRGGLGVVTEMTNLVPGTWSLSTSARQQCPPWGLFGGSDGLPGRAEFRSSESEEWEWVVGRRIPVEAGTHARVLSGGGGGWGDPADRPHAEIENDILAGYVSLEAAVSSYGYVEPEGADAEGAEHRESPRL